MIYGLILVVIITLAIRMFFAVVRNVKRKSRQRNAETNDTLKEYTFSPPENIGEIRSLRTSLNERGGGFLRLKHFGIFVGTKGFVIYRISKKEKMFFSPTAYFYEDMQAIYFPKTHHYVNGIDSGISYDFRFVDKFGNNSYHKRGKYFDYCESCDQNQSCDRRKGCNGWEISVLEEIEEMWTSHILEQLLSHATKPEFESIKFQDAGNYQNAIEVGKGFLKYKDKRFPREQI
jgi:hypothetical protein